MADVWKKFGTIRRGKLPGSLYLKVDDSVTLKTGDAVFLQDPRKKIDESVTAGRLEAEKGEEMKSKIPDYIRYEVVLAPPKKA